MFNGVQTMFNPQGIARDDKYALLVNRWLTQIQLVAPGGPSKVAKVRRAPQTACFKEGPEIWFRSRDPKIPILEQQF